MPKAIGRGLTTSLAAGLGFAVVLFQLSRGWPPRRVSGGSPLRGVVDGLPGWDSAAAPITPIQNWKPAGKE